LLGGRDACTREKVSFYIVFEGNLRVGRSEIIREAIPKGRASMLKTTRGKSNIKTNLAQRNLCSTFR